MFNIISLTDFLRSFRSALDSRLRAASHIFGQSYTQSIRIQTYRASYIGTTISIVNCVIESIEPFPVLASHRPSAAFGREADEEGGAGPNVKMPQGALTQVMLGYAGWEELKRTVPDVAIHRSVVRVVEILWPKREMGGYLF